MSMNKFMHPKNIYRTPPDYTELAIKYPEFREKCELNLDGKCKINLKNIENLSILTKTLLKEHFDLKIELPNDSLIPTIPLRLNYILWLEDIMVTMDIDNPKGIDIGCGASCIYSLLIAKKCKWKMLALETNIENFSCAKHNIEINNLTGAIEIFQKSDKNSIFTEYFSSIQNDSNDGDDKVFDFCLCNPPFFDTTNFETESEIGTKRSGSHNVKTGKIDELSCSGGELLFIKQIIDESFQYHDKIKIFTTMIGRKNDLLQLQKYLRDKFVTNSIQAEFCQGHTTRWALAWSFYPKFILGLVPSLGFHKQKEHFNYTVEINSKMKDWKNKLKIEIQKMQIDTMEILKENENQIHVLLKVFECKTNEKERKQSIDNPLIDDFPKLIFKIEADVLDYSKLHIKVIYLCGLLGIGGCQKYFYDLKNKIQNLLGK